MEKMVDRTVLVPVEPTDIMNSISCTLLPRTMADSAVVAIDFKRMKKRLESQRGRRTLKNRLK